MGFSKAISKFQPLGFTDDGGEFDGDAVELDFSARGEYDNVTEYGYDTCGPRFVVLQNECNSILKFEKREIKFCKTIIRTKNADVRDSNAL